MPRLLAIVLGSSLCAAACGGPAPGPSTASQGARGGGGEETVTSSDTLAVSGLRGTLSTHEIQGALEPKLPRFLRCVEQRLADVDVLSGEIAFLFQVALDGTVTAVAPSRSSLGDRQAERCMLQVAAGTRFPAPHGGEAEFTWPLEVPIDPEVRPPVELPPDSLGALLAERATALNEQCGGGAQVLVTAYLDPNGQVLAAGAAATGEASSTQLDCISEGVRALRFPSPGSYLGKLSFAVPASVEH